MAISQTERDQILKIVAGLFNGAPGGDILNDLSQAVEAGVSMAQLADILAGKDQFKNDIMGGKTTTADQVGVLLEHFGLTPDGEAGSPATLAEEFFTARIEGGAGFGAIVLEAVTFLESTTDEAFAPYSALLNSKALVASVHADNYATIAGVAGAQALFVGVTSEFPATEEDALQHVKDILGPDNGEPGEPLALTAGAFEVPVVTAQDNAAKAILADFELEGVDDLPASLTATIVVGNGVLGNGGNAQLSTVPNNPNTLEFVGTKAQLAVALKEFEYASASANPQADSLTITLKTVSGQTIGAVSETISVGKDFAYTSETWDGKTVTGTAQADLFSGSQTDVIKATALDGGAGYDVLQVSAVTGVGTLTDGISTTGIERVELALTGTATVDASKFAGVETLTVAGDVATLTELSTDTIAVLESDHNLNVGLAAAQAAGETFNLALNEATISGKTITDSKAADAEAIKNLTLHVAQNANITLAAGSALKDINVVNAGDLDAAFSGLTDFTLNAAAAEGNLTLDLAGTGKVNLTGGKGVNTFDFGLTLTSDDVVVGGDLNEDEDNQDVLTATVSATAANNAFKISKVEEITFTASGDADNTVDATNISGADSIAINQAAMSGKTFTLKNAESATEVSLDVLDINNTVLVDGVRDGAEVSFSVTGATVGTLSAMGAETVNIETSGAAVVLAALTTTGANKLVVTGDQDLDITAGLATAINTVDLSAFEATFAATVRGGSTVLIGEDAEVDLTLAVGVAGGADTIKFVFDGEEGKAAFGNQAITGFEVARDKIDLSDFGITVDDISLAVAHTISVDTGDNAFNIVLTGVDTGDLTIDNFVFA